MIKFSLFITTLFSTSSVFALELNADRIWCSVNLVSSSDSKKTLMGAASDSIFRESIHQSSQILESLKKPHPFSLYNARTYTYYSSQYPVVLEAKDLKTQLNFYVRSKIQDKDSKQHFIVYSTLRKNDSESVLASVEFTENTFQSAMNEGLKLSFSLAKESALNIGDLLFDKVELFCAAADAEKEIPQFNSQN